jgi:hypothetical protein
MRKKLLLLPLALCASVEAATQYELLINTTPFAGTSGSLQFVLSSAGLPPSVTASVQKLSVVGGTPSSSPDVNFNNSALFDFAMVPVTYGTEVDFLLAFATGPLVFPLANGTTFDVGLLDANGNYLVNSANGGGPVFELNLQVDGSLAAAPFNSSVRVALLPEPASFALTGSMLFGLAFIRKRFMR